MSTLNINRSMLSAFGGMPTYTLLAEGTTLGVNVILFEMFNARRQRP